MRILVIRRDNIGDLVCTTPLFAALRARFPQARIVALVNSYNAAVLDGNPDVDDVLSYTKLKHRLPGQSRVRILLDRLGMMARLRREVFDYVLLAKAGFDRQGLSLARQLKRREIAGYAPPEGREDAITLAVPGQPDPALHEVEVIERIGALLGVAEARGPVRVFPDADVMAALRTRLPGLATRPSWIGVHISAREASRQWPAGKWIELIGRLAAAGEVGVVLLWAPGSAAHPRHPGDDEKAAAILDALRGAPVAPAPTAELGDLIAALGVCKAFIGADGGAMHLAAALGLPVVALFEDIESKRRRWHPWRVPHELVAPEVAVEQVVEAWQRLAPAALRQT